MRLLSYPLAFFAYAALVVALSPFVGIDMLTSILQVSIMAPVFAGVLFVQHLLLGWQKVTAVAFVGGTFLANLVPPGVCLAFMLGIAKSGRLSSRKGGVDMFVDGDATREGLLSVVRGIAPFYFVGVLVCLVLFLLVRSARQA